MTVRRDALRSALVTVGPVVVGAVEVAGLALTPAIVRASDCLELDCLLVAVEVLAVMVIACGGLGVAVLWMAARQSRQRHRSPAATLLVAGSGAACWILLAMAWHALVYRAGNLNSTAAIVVTHLAGVLGTTGVGYLAVAATRRGGHLFGWFCTAALAAILITCAASYLPNLL